LARAIQAIWLGQFGQFGSGSTGNLGNLAKVVVDGFLAEIRLVIVIFSLSFFENNKKKYALFGKDDFTRNGYGGKARKRREAFVIVPFTMEGKEGKEG
jgi:hypothetical protein